MLTLVTPYQTHPYRQRLQIYLWSGVIFVMFSVLISLFRVKNRGMSNLYILPSNALLTHTYRLSVQALAVDCTAHVKSLVPNISIYYCMVIRA